MEHAVISKAAASTIMSEHLIVFLFMVKTFLLSNPGLRGPNESLDEISIYTYPLKGFIEFPEDSHILL